MTNQHKKMIQKLVSELPAIGSDEFLFGYVKGQERVQIKNTTEQIVAFIMENRLNDTIITDLLDEKEIETVMGSFIMYCRDQRYLQEGLLPELVPVQRWEKEAPLFVPYVPEQEEGLVMADYAALYELEEGTWYRFNADLSLSNRITEIKIEEKKKVHIRYSGGEFEEPFSFMFYWTKEALNKVWNYHFSEDSECPHDASSDVTLRQLEEESVLFYDWLHDLSEESDASPYVKELLNTEEV